MFGVVMAAALVVTSAASLSGEGNLPAGTFACSLLAAEKYDGESALMISTLGEITLDGNGGYTQGMASGLVVWMGDNALHFTSGEMSGTVAVVRKNGIGQRYLHIDGSMMTAPTGEPKFGDHICVQK